MRIFIDRLSQVAGGLAGVFMVLTLLSVLSSIVGRLLPVLALPGADAYAGYCMAIAAFLSLGTTLRRGEHIRVTLLLNRLPDRGRRRLDLFCHVVALAVAILLTWYAVRLVRQSFLFNDISPGLDATLLWIPQIGMAAGSALLGLAFAAELFDLATGRKTADMAGSETENGAENGTTRTACDAELPHTE